MPTGTIHLSVPSKLHPVLPHPPVIGSFSADKAHCIAVHAHCTCLYKIDCPVIPFLWRKLSGESVAPESNKLPGSLT